MKKILFFTFIFISAALSAQTGTGWGNIYYKMNLKDSVNLAKSFRIGNVWITPSATQFNYLDIASGRTGTGNLVFSNSPVFTTPNIGTATGSITGNAATVTTNANLTGVVTSVGNATSFAASPTFTGTVTIPSPFTLGATSVTANGTELNVLDNIPGTLTSTELGYVDGVTSSIQTQINSFTGGILSVLSYGAHADGVTDDAAHIQAALTAGIGKMVYFPAGTYLITAPLFIGSNTTVVGQGRENTIIKADPTMIANGMFSFLHNARNITIKDLCIDGDNTSFTPEGEHSAIRSYSTALSYSHASEISLINLEIKNTSESAVIIEQGCKNWTLENCYIHKVGDGTLNAAGIYVSTVDGFKVNNCRIDSAKQHGIYLGEGTNVMITNSFFRYNGYNPPGDVYGTGMSIRADSNVVIANNHIMFNRENGLDLNSNRHTVFALSPLKNVTVTGNEITYNGNFQVMIAGVNKAVLSGNLIGHGSGAWSANSGIRLYADNKDISILSNAFHSGYGVLVSADSVDNISIKNNTFSKGNSLIFSYGVYISDVVHGDNMTITGNTGYRPTYGVRIGSDEPERLTIKNNDWVDWVSFDVSNEGAIADHNIEYKGSSSFTTTADRKAIYINGLTTDYDATVTIDMGSDATHPNANDVISGYCKADSLIVKRVVGTSGTSGLKFKYIVNND